MSKASDTSCDILTVDTENVTSAKNQDYFFRKTKSQSASASRDQSEPLRGSRDIRNANAEK